MLKKKKSSNNIKKSKITNKYEIQQVDQDKNLKQTCNDVDLISNDDKSVLKNNKKQINESEQNYQNRIDQFNNPSFKDEQNEDNSKEIELENQQHLDIEKLDSSSDIRVENDNKLKRKLFDVIFSSIGVLQRYKFTPQTKFYLFGDQIIDLDHIRSVLNNTSNEYIREQQPMSVLQSIKFVNNVIHRMDNKYIQVQSEVADRYLESIDPIIKMIKSLGQQNLYDFIDVIQGIWNGLVLFRKLIHLQSLDPLFQQHKKDRFAFAENSFNNIVSNLDQKKLICYIYYNVNYDRQQFDSCCTGFSPGLYELLAGNSYAFKQYLQKNGYLDPIHQSFKLKSSVKNANTFLEKKKQKQELPSNIPEQQSELITLDSFIFPTIVKIQIITPEKEYDIQNNLKFNVSNMLLIYEFILLDDKIPQQLQISRKNTQYRNNESKFYSYKIQPENDILQSEFIQKYYQDDLSYLIDQGSKWFKRCGFVDIPKKKRKNQNQDSDNNDDNQSTSID